MKFFLFILPFAAYAFPITPNVPGDYCTPQNPDFKEYRYAEQIPVCTRNVSLARKDSICKKVGVTDRTDFTIDHIIPLSLGGSNSDTNLWCQHKSLNVTREEYTQYLEVSKGLKTQAEARKYLLGLKFGSVCSPFF